MASTSKFYNSALLLLFLTMILDYARATAAADGSNSNRQVMAWMYHQSDNADWWNESIAHINERKQNLSSISLTPYYGIMGDGSFGYQSDGQIAEKYNPYFVSMGLLTYPKIGASGGIASVAALIDSPTKVTQFVNDAVQKAVAQNYSGYNLDIEIQSNNQTSPEKWISFVNELADALHSNGMQLGSDIGGCPKYDTWVNCSLYQSSKIDSVISMNTYTSNNTIFVENVKYDVSILGPAMYNIGFEMNAVLTNLSNLDYAKSLGVSTIALWTVPLSGDGDGQPYWDAMGYWLL